MSSGIYLLATIQMFVDMDTLASQQGRVADFGSSCGRTPLSTSTGESLATGADTWHISSREQLRHMRDGDADLCALNNVVSTGGQWPRERQKREGYDVDTLCPRCREAPEDLFHRIRACKANCGHDDYASTDYLVEQASPCAA